MFEIEPEMLSRGGLVFVDGTEACTREAGEFQNYSGQLAEVGSFCGNGADEGAAKKAWEEAGGDLTIFKSGLSLLLLLPWNRTTQASGTDYLALIRLTQSVSLPKTSPSPS
jgi:hypothetical protein